MQILDIDYDYYLLPNGIDSVTEFADFVNRPDRSQFIPFTRFETENCCPPFFIEEDVKEVYLNVDRIERFNAVEATILPRREYELRLAEVVKNKCVHCEHYEEDHTGDNLAGHREMISLDGKCSEYSARENG